MIPVAKPSGSKQSLTNYPPHLLTLPPHSPNAEAVSTSKTISLAALLHTKERISDMMTFETSSMGITVLRAPTCTTGPRDRTCTSRLTEVTSTFQTANATLEEKTAEFLTADDGLPPGNPCASTTRLKEATIPENSDDSINSTRDSSHQPPAANEEKHISPEQLRNLEPPRRYPRPCQKNLHR